MSRRVIAVFTGNRGEYGLQYPVLKRIEAHPRLDYRLIVSGAHLDPHFGRTLAEIEKDGFAVHAEVKIELAADTLSATAQAIGSGVIAMSKTLESLRPDVLMLYGDRFETFAAAIASTQTNIPTAHIEGGDITEGGALDDSVRHAISKLAHLHFTTNEQATRRLLAMGEEPWRVHTVGFPPIDLIGESDFAAPEELRERYGVDLARPIVIFTQHSVTTEFERAVDQLEPSLEALERLVAEGTQVIVTFPNNDAGGRHMIARLEDFAAGRGPGLQLHRSLGRHAYHGFLALAREPRHLVACVGNSSSGIKETPAFGCPCVNIGSRQQGRLRADNVMEVDYDADEIHGAVRRCLDDAAFRESCRSVVNPYGVGDAGEKIAEVLAEVPLDTRLLRKGMTLLGETRDGWYR